MTSKLRSQQSIGTREAILVAASRLFAAKGYHATTTRDIAAEVGVKQPALFHYFNSKAAIMEALQHEDIVKTTEMLREAVAVDASNAVRLYVALYREVRYMLGGPYDFGGTSTAAVLNDPDFAKARTWWDELLAARTELIRNGVDSGDFIDIDPNFANRAILWTIEGLMADANIVANSAGLDLADTAVSFAMRAILSERSSLDDVRKEALAICAGIEPLAAPPE